MSHSNPKQNIPTVSALPSDLTDIVEHLDILQKYGRQNRLTALMENHGRRQMSDFLKEQDGKEEPPNPFDTTLESNGHSSDDDDPLPDDADKSQRSHGATSLVDASMVTNGEAAPGPKNAIAETEFVDIYAMKDMWRAKEQLANSEFDLTTLCKPSAQRRELLHVSHQQLFTCRELAQEFPNLREFFEIVSGAATLCYLGGTPIKLPNLLLDGPPGCGKTRAITRLAEALELPLYTIYMTNLHGRFELVGGHRSYRASEPGLLSKLLLEAPCANPLVLFDEAENGDPDLYGSLYSFLEDKVFKDHYLQLGLVTEHMNKILVTNDKEKLLPAIRSRVREMKIVPPGQNEMMAIIQRIYSDLRLHHIMYQRFAERLSADVVGKLITLPLRQIRLCLENAMCKAAFARWQSDELTIIVDDLPEDDGLSTKHPPGFTAW